MADATHVMWLGCVTIMLAGTLRTTATWPMETTAGTSATSPPVAPQGQTTASAAESSTGDVQTVEAGIPGIPGIPATTTTATVEATLPNVGVVNEGTTSPQSVGATTVATTVAGTLSPSTTATMVPVTLPNVGVVNEGTLPPESVPWTTTWKFHCDRPTTHCDLMYGMCDLKTGTCNCFNQAFGLQCKAINTAMQNAQVCAFYECKRGVCYDDGVGAKCSCPDGYYGDRCEHSMVYAECTHEKMVVNIYPYGYSDVLWDYIPPPSTETCPLHRMSTFLASASSYNNRGWKGFAREFLHKADPCAGDVTIEYNPVPDSTVYSRRIYVFYEGARHHTDTEIKVTCEVLNNLGGVGVSGLPVPRVNIQVMDLLSGNRLTGPIKLGAPIIVKFSVNPVNNANIDDLRVDSCTVTDGVGSQRIIILDHGCAVPPMGELVFKGQPGTQFLSLTMHSFPGSSQLVFQCRVQLCDSLKTNACGMTQICSRRRRRSSKNTTSQDVGRIEEIQFLFTKSLARV